MPKLRYNLVFIAFLAVCAAPASSQERLLTNGTRAHLDARFSPDGAWVAYQGQGDLFVRRSSGQGREVKIHSAGVSMSYIWEKNSASLVVFAFDKLLRISRDGNSKSQIAKLTGQGVQDVFFLTNDGVWVYGVRRTTKKSIVMRVRISDGKLEDVITSIPGVTSIDLDRSGKKILVSATVFLFQYQFWQADLDGKNVVSINGKALTSLAGNGRWLDTTKTLMFEHVGLWQNKGSGFQVWTMDAATGNHRPLTWLPRERKGIPSLSADGKWITMLEHRSGTGTARALVFPADGGGEAVLSQPLFQMGSRIEMSRDGKSVLYVGADKRKNKADVRIFAIDRLLRLNPMVRIGNTSTLSFQLSRSETGVVFLGFALSRSPIRIPGLTGAFELDLTAMMPLLTGAFKDVQGPFVVPNDNALVGKSLFLQALRLTVGPKLSGAFLPTTHVDIAR